MSITREITLWCDDPECMEWIQFNDFDSKGGNASAARALARKAGWSVIGNPRRDVCPYHNPRNPKFGTQPEVHYDDSHY